MTTILKEYTVKGPGVIDGVKYNSILLSFVSPKDISTIDQINIHLESKSPSIIFDGKMIDKRRTVSPNGAPLSATTVNQKGTVGSLYNTYPHELVIFTDGTFADDFNVVHFYRHDVALEGAAEVIVIRINKGNATQVDIVYALSLVNNMKPFNEPKSINGPYDRSLNLLEERATGGFGNSINTDNTVTPRRFDFYWRSSNVVVSEPSLAEMKKNVKSAYEVLKKAGSLNDSVGGEQKDFDSLFKQIMRTKTPNGLFKQTRRTKTSNGLKLLTPSSNNDSGTTNKKRFTRVSLTAGDIRTYEYMNSSETGDGYSLVRKKIRRTVPRVEANSEEDRQNSPSKLSQEKPWEVLRRIKEENQQKQRENSELLAEQKQRDGLRRLNEATRHKEAKRRKNLTKLTPYEEVALMKAHDIEVLEGDVITALDENIPKRLKSLKSELDVVIPLKKHLEGHEFSKKDFLKLEDMATSITARLKKLKLEEEKLEVNNEK